MKGSVKTIGLVVCLSLLLTTGIVFATGGTSTTVTKPGTTTVKPQPQGPCCIAGKYNGYHKDIPSKTCPTPGDGKFIMVINQDKGCGSKIWGTVTDAKDGTIQNFEGKVIQRDKCCYIEGVMKKPAATAAVPAEETKFSGLLCKKGGKWSGKGKYTSTRGTTVCNGDWNMTQ